MSEIEVKRGVLGEDVRNQAKYALFVEGTDPENGIDPVVLKELFPNGISVKVLGPSFHVESAARALAGHHPNYFFLIDRDHHNDKFVENCWNADTPNLLVWRKRELENYFIDPDYLGKSAFFAEEKTQDELQTLILKLCRERLLLDVVNQVIVSIREDQKCNWIKFFSDSETFMDFQDAVKKLISKPEIHTRAREISSSLDENKLKELLAITYEKFTGNRFPLEYGHGEWLNLIRGKKILSQIIHNTSLFTVPDARKRHLQGKEKLNEIVKNLLRREDKYLPPDFLELRNLIRNRIPK
jgi:hypothetical protein